MLGGGDMRVEGGGGRREEGDIKQYWEGRLTLIPYYISCHINKIETIQEFTLYNTTVVDEQNKAQSIFAMAPPAFLV